MGNENQSKQFSRNQIMGSMSWQYAEKLLAQIIEFVVSVVLARLLEPSVYGQIAMVTIFITLSNLFANAGFGHALIQKKDADATDYSTVFIISFITVAFLYALLYFTAPAISAFYEQDLTSIIRVLALLLWTYPIDIIQKAFISKHLLFKKMFWSSLTGTILSAIIGIYGAFNGWGVWALVAYKLTDQFVDVLFLFATIRLVPNMKFSKKSGISLFSFGWKLLASDLLDQGDSELRQLIIGKVFTSETLAFYNKGPSIPKLIMNNINSTIGTVMFPVASNAQGSDEELKRLTRKCIRVSLYIILPILVGIAAVAEPLVTILFTEKWLPCVPYMQISCFVLSGYMVQIYIQNAIKAKGKPEIMLGINIASKSIALVLLVVVIFVLGKGPLWVMGISFITVPLNILAKIYFSKRVFGYKYREHLADHLPLILINAIMGVCVYCIKFFGFNAFVTLGLQVACGVLIYIAISIITKNKEFSYLLAIIKEKLHGRKIKSAK